VPSDELVLAAIRTAAERRLAGQRRHWSAVLESRADRYGTTASAPAEHAADLFARAGAHDVLELGAGQGRDSLHFAERGFNVRALDFAESGVLAIRAKAEEARLQGSLRASVHDCREPLPFADNSFDACFSHMLFCMALTTAQLTALSAEVLRVLRPGGIHVYTVRSTADPDCGAGLACGDGLYESSGFIVHFFSRELVTRLARGFELVEIFEFEEGDLPRRLFRVTLVKPARDSAARLQDREPLG
jgi:SAM-dependent methyltransferase